ncbi:hypothetical protein FGB62_13g146 [Gracilaria domingensis]|nr:hypothetical protein FGB62_13g146 [Gracilaria domingensis]
MDAARDGSLIAAAGMDRVLHLFDVRMMGVRERWPSCLKYEVAAALLSRDLPGMAYVCSVDNEVACGAWSDRMARRLKQRGSTQSLMISGANAKSARRAFGFRADVRVVGIARRCADGEEIGAMSESGAFYLLRASRVDTCTAVSRRIDKDTLHITHRRGCGAGGAAAG